MCFLVASSRARAHPAFLRFYKAGVHSGLWLREQGEKMQGGNLSPRSPKKRQLPAENGWRPKRLRRFRRTLSSTVGGQQGPAKKVLVVVEELMGQLLGHEQSFYFRKPVEEDQDLDEVFLQMCATLCSGAPARSSRAPSPQACERGAGGCPAGGACFHFGCGGLLRALFLSPHPLSSPMAIVSRG